MVNMNFSPSFRIAECAVKQDDLRRVLLPKLRSRVFHVTSGRGLEGIQTSHSVSANIDGKLGFTFPQSENSFGRRRGYVCMFDLRGISEEHLKFALEGFFFLDPYGRRENPVFLFLAPARYGDIIHSRVAKPRGGEMWIPYVEAWYPRDLPLSEIDQVLSVKIERPPESDFEKAIAARDE